MVGQIAPVQNINFPVTNFNPILPTIGQGGTIPAIQSLFVKGSPQSRVGRLKHTVAQHFGGMRRVPLPILALVADSKSFRVNNLNMQRGLERGFVKAGKTVHAHKRPSEWADAMIESRFSNVDLRRVAQAKYRSIHWDHLRLPFLRAKYGDESVGFSSQRVLIALDLGNEAPSRIAAEAFYGSAMSFAALERSPFFPAETFFASARAFTDEEVPSLPSAAEALAKRARELEAEGDYYQAGNLMLSSARLLIGWETQDLAHEALGLENIRPVGDKK